MLSWSGSFVSRLDDKVANGLAAVSIWCSRNAKAVVLVALLLTTVFGYGVAQITTNVDVADVLPRGNYNTEAAHDLTEKFRSTFTQQVTLQLHVDDDPGHAHWTRDNAKLLFRGQGLGGTPADALLGPVQAGASLAALPNNITDEVYVRAIDELVRFVEARTDFTRSISISNIYSLINWTIAGGDGSGNGGNPAPESAFALPGYQTRQEALQYVLVDQAVKRAVLDTVDAISSPSWNHAATLFMPAADNTKPTKALGEEMLKVRDEYVQAVADGKTQFTVFGPQNPPLFTVDLPIANAHSSDLVKEDTLKLMPLIAAFLAVCLFIAFRNLRSILVSITVLAVGVVWSYGTMGFMGIPLNTLNMAVVPLILGVGVDYAIHVINEFSEHKAEGHGDADALRIAASRSGMAMLIATATTVGGLVVLIFSPSLLIAQLGLISAVAMTVIYLFSLTFLPATLTLLGGSERLGRSFSRSRVMPALARGITKMRYVVAVLILVVSAVAFVAANGIGKEAFGDPGKNYLPSDPIRKEHEQGLKDFYEAPDSDEKANILTFAGTGILTPQAMDYYRAIEANLKTEPRVIPDTLRTLPFFIETWLTVKGGAAGAVVNVGEQNLLNPPAPPSIPLLPPGTLPPPVLPDPVKQQVDPFPKTEDAIKKEVDGMFNSPMRQLASIIINYPANDMAAMTFSVRALSYQDAEQVWGQVWDAVGKANATFGGHAPGDIRVAFVGNTATNYLFIADELPWLGYMAIANNILLGVLVLALSRNIKMTVVTLLLSTLTSLWWLAILPQLGIGLAITLTLPFAFIIAIGTDYGVHFMWAIRQSGNAREVFESTGKAVLFSSITSIGAFVCFIAVQNVAVSRTMVATTVAFAVIFVVTVLVVPIFYNVEAKKRKRERAADPAHADA